MRVIILVSTRLVLPYINANLQVRSEPTIPKGNVGPWNNTTIEADNLRRNLDIGGLE